MISRRRRSTAAADREEIERFKRDVNLTEYAAARGYLVDRRESSQGSVVMRHAATDDKIVVACRDGRWTYFSVRDSSDNGTVIDFVQRRNGATLGEARKDLRHWLGSSRPVVPSEAYLPTLASPARDRAAVNRLFEAARAVENVAYLNERGIRPETLASPRFRATFRQDTNCNVLFPHHDREGLSGFESKNRHWTAFAAGGAKSLWSSRIEESDCRLVIAESAIDALSYHQLQSHPRTRYLSTAGTLGHRQSELLAEVIARLSPQSVIVAAFDADQGGEKLTADVQAVAQGVTVERHAPPIPKDWNDTLKIRERDYIRSIERSPPFEFK